MSNKITKQNKNLFDTRNSSLTFMKIMQKYKNRKKEKILTNEGYISKAIEEKREKLEFEEKDNMYIYKEAKNIANMNQLLINLYGNKAKKRFYDISKYFSPIKLDKKLFFESNNNKEKKEKYNLDSNILNKKGMMKLPLISRNDLYINKIDANNKNFKTIENIKTLDRKKIMDKLLYKDKNNIKIKEGIEALKLKISNNNNNYNKINDKQRASKSTKNIFNLNNKYSKRQIKEYKSKDNIKKENGDDFVKIKLNKNILSLSENYISRLTNFKDLLIEEEKQKRKYFNKNDYGCKSFKEKYKYLNSKYFD